MIEMQPVLGSASTHDLCHFCFQVGSEGGVDDPYLRQFWRGRMNTTKEDQIQMFENPAILEEQDSEDEGHETDSESSSSGSSSSSSDSDSVRLALQ